MDGVATTTAGLRMRGLSARLGDRLVLRAIDLHVAPGEVVVIQGASGAGKTTLLRAAAGLLPYEGRVEAGGRPAVVFQQHALAGRLTATQNVLVGTLGRIGFVRATLRLWPAAERTLAADCLDRVGLAGFGPRRAAHLSGGQRQRVAIARALAQRAPVLLADEPVASLDPDNAAAVLTLLQGLARRDNLAVLLCLHQPDLAERFGDRLLYLRDGCLEGRPSFL